MKFYLLILIVFFASCENKVHKPNNEGMVNVNHSESMDTVNAAVHSQEKRPEFILDSLTERLRIKFNGKIHILSDEEGNWKKDDMDSIILPARNKNPLYPTIAKGDFDWDGKEDIAALVADHYNGNYNVAIFLKDDKIIIWPGDVKGAGIITYKSPDRSTLQGNQVVLKGDGILVQWFKGSAYVIHWNGKEFVRAWTGD